ncbi:MAG: hypothetical protein CBC83_07445 [Flavobacteriales bacterium TMED123]|nr:MAG: hypothetical protein CBC83_07445 [Flavobacteriales bacterium TMED123]|tara:strand:+ start:226 stop:411 length:186 start_codon:yes stop_codon:yes gene_type:complete
MRNKFRYFNSSPEEIRLTVMIYVRYALSLRQVEDLFHKRGNGFVWLKPICSGTASAPHRTR